MNNGKIDKILNKINFKRQLSGAKSKQVKAEYELMTENEKLKEVKNDVNLVKSIKINGLLLYGLSFLGLVASTSLSLAGGLPYYNGISRTAFIIAICFVQLAIFKASTLETIIKTKFNNHYISFKLLQYGLLSVSVYYNYDFFLKHSIGFKPITLILCILLDVSTIKFISLAWDSNRLNYSKLDNIETQGLLKMICFNMMFKLKLRTINLYKENVKTLKGSLEQPKDVRTNVKTILEQPVKTSLNNVINLKTDVKTNNVLSFLVKTYKSGDKVDVKTLKQSFNMSAREWQKVKTEIQELVTKGTNTYYKELETEKYDEKYS